MWPVFTLRMQHHPAKNLLSANSFPDYLCPVAHYESSSLGWSQDPGGVFVFAGARSPDAVGIVKSSAAQGLEATNLLVRGTIRLRLSRKIAAIRITYPSIGLS